MTKQQNRTKKIHYRQASFFQASPLTLQELLGAALRIKAKVAERYRLLGVNSLETPSTVVEREFINTNVSRYAMFFGSLIRYEAGSNKHILTVDDNAGTLSLDQIVPPTTKDGKRQEFLDSILHFAVFGNHLVVLQSASLKTRELEKHLNWLFREAGVFDNQQRLSLDQQLTEDAKTKILNAPTKRLKVGAPLDAPEVQQGSEVISNLPTNVQAPETKKISLHRTGPGWDVLKALGFNEGSIKEQLERDLDASSNLEIRVEISYKRAPKGETQSLMNGLTKALRHTELEDYEVEFKGAGSLKGDKLILSADISLKYFNGLVDEEDFYLKVHSWIIDRIREGVLKV